MTRIAKQYKNNTIRVNRQWCKGCGICTVICGKSVFVLDNSGKTVIANPMSCTGCHKCETHCPDFAIAVGEVK